MIILDENFPDSQRQLLRGWRVSFRQIAFEIGREGMTDDEIISLLHGLNRPTFFMLDEDFFKPGDASIMNKINYRQDSPFRRQYPHPPDDSRKPQ